MDANPDCKLCGGTGRITAAQAGLTTNADDVVASMNEVACFRCWLGMDEPMPTTVTPLRVSDPDAAAAEAMARLTKPGVRLVRETELARLRERVAVLEGAVAEANVRVWELAREVARNPSGSPVSAWATQLVALGNRLNDVVREALEGGDRG